MVNWEPIVDIAKILGKVVKDTIDVGDYRITVIIEKKIDDKQGVVIEHISVDKRMNALETDIIARKLRSVIEKNG